MVDDIGIPTDFGEPPASPPSDAKLCAAEGCTTYFVPTGFGAAKARAKYCPEHKPAPRAKKAGGGKDRAPRGVNVTVQVGGTKKGKDAELDKVRERAEQLANFLAMLAGLAGQPDDAADLRNAAAPWADSVRELARHEEWLRKLAQGGEATERTLAWFGFVVSTAVMLLPILTRHKVIPENVAQMFGQAMVEAPVVVEPAAA